MRTNSCYFVRIKNKLTKDIVDGIGNARVTLISRYKLSRLLVSGLCLLAHGSHRAGKREQEPFCRPLLSVTTPMSQLILKPFRRLTYVTAYSPTLPLLHLCHSSFSDLSFASPTSQALDLIYLVSRPWQNTGSYYWDSLSLSEPEGGEVSALQWSLPGWRVATLCPSTRR